MVQMNDVRMVYGNTEAEALSGVSFTINEGEFVFLVGPSGSGKTTIIKLITGEIALTQGKLMVNGYSLNNISPRQVPLMRRTLGIIFQDFRLIDKKTVYENLAFAMRAIGASSRDLKRRIPYVLQLVGLDQKADRYPGQLSGGEQQRVILARALAQQTPCLILDEPTNHLDIKYQLELMDIVKSLDRTVISAIHDLNIAAMYCDRLYAVKGGEIVGCGRPQEVLTEDFIRRVYEVEAKVFSDESGQLHILYHPAHRL